MRVLRPTRRGLLRVALLLLVALAVLQLYLVLVVDRNLNHDEHQFVASGALLATRGLLPYEDYPYFHVPYLVYIYGALFHVSSYYLLLARLFSMLCALALLATLFYVGWRWSPTVEPRARWLLAGGAGLLLLFNPLFAYTSGRAWNHDLPVLLAVWATLLLLGAPRASRPWLWRVGSGLLVGLATGTRLSFAVMIPALLALSLAVPVAPLRARLRRALVVAGGIALALLPLAWSVARAPAQVRFGVWEYARLNTRYRAATGYEAAMSLPGKVLFLARDVLLADWGTLVLLLGWVGFGVGLLRARPTSRRAVTWAATLWLLPFLLVGALAPTPSFPQYFYALVPFLVLGLLASAAALWARWPTWTGRAWLSLLALTLVAGLPAFRDVADVWQPSRWRPIALHRVGTRIAELAGQQRVLTLAPILPLEGGSDVYETFVTGPFAVRAAQMTPPERLAAQNLVPPNEIEARLAPDPPRAILVGLDAEDVEEEAALVAFARRHPYMPLTMGDGQVLWLTALADWGEAIRLAAAPLPRDPLDPGDPFELTLFLQGLAPIDRDLNVLVRVVGPDGREWLRDEGWPWGRPTSTWEPGAVWYDGHTLAMPPDVPPGYYRVDVSFYDPETLAPLPVTDGWTGEPLGETWPAGFVRVGVPPVPRPSLLAPARFGDALHLRGVAMRDAAGQPTTTLAPGDTLRLALAWDATAPLPDDYTLFVHLVDVEGGLVAQQDQPPLGGFLPTSRWQPGAIVADEVALELPPDLPAGPYTLHLGWYQPTTGARLPVRDARGSPLGDHLRLGPLRVQPTP